MDFNKHIIHKARRWHEFVNEFALQLRGATPETIKEKQISAQKSQKMCSTLSLTLAKRHHTSSCDFAYTDFTYTWEFQPPPTKDTAQLV